MTSIKTLTERLSVAPQIEVGDFSAIAAAGFKTVINNRPDGEEPGQLAHDRAAKAAQDAGLAYHYLPITMATLDEDAIARFAALLRDADGPVLAHCKSGGRSTLLWALGADLSPDGILETAMKAGFDLNSQRPVLDARYMARKNICD